MKLTTLVMVVAMLFTTPILAANVSTKGLTDQQEADLRALVATQQAANVKNGTDKVVETIVGLDEEDVSRYAELGSVMVKTITETASGLGKSVDEFMDTGTGTMVMFLIVYHYFGSQLVAMVIGFGFCIPLTLWLGRRFLRSIKTSGYSEPDKDGKQHLVYKTELTDFESQSVAWVYGITTVMMFIEILLFLP